LQERAERVLVITHEWVTHIRPKFCAGHDVREIGVATVGHRRKLLQAIAAAEECPEIHRGFRATSNSAEGFLRCLAGADGRIQVSAKIGKKTVERHQPDIVAPVKAAIARTRAAASCMASAASAFAMGSPPEWPHSSRKAL
jgi:hypothetical protein